MNEKPRWYVVNRDADNLKLRGPYQHGETADAVRKSLGESDAPTP